MSSNLDIIIGRKGIEAITGTVNDKTFVIATVFGDLTIPKLEIAQIHYRNPPQFNTDEIWTRIGDKHTGEIKSKVVDFTFYTGQPIKIPTNVIHTIFMMGGYESKAPSLPKPV